MNLFEFFDVESIVGDLAVKLTNEITDLVAGKLEAQSGKGVTQFIDIDVTVSVGINLYGGQQSSVKVSDAHDNEYQLSDSKVQF